MIYKCVAMKSRERKVDAEAFLRNIRVRLEYTESELRRVTASIKRTNEALRSSRERILRTNPLVQPDEKHDTELKRAQDDYVHPRRGAGF